MVDPVDQLKHKIFQGRKASADVARYWIPFDVYGRCGSSIEVNASSIAKIIICNFGQKDLSCLN